jgi:hypothetical protein
MAYAQHGTNCIIKRRLMASFDGQRVWLCGGATKPEEAAGISTTYNPALRKGQDFIWERCEHQKDSLVFAFSALS